MVDEGELKSKDTIFMIDGWRTPAEQVLTQKNNNKKLVGGISDCHVTKFRWREDEDEYESYMDRLPISNWGNPEHPDTEFNFNRWTAYVDGQNAFHVEGSCLVL